VLLLIVVIVGIYPSWLLRMIASAASVFGRAS
jgi:hypothetical protein